MPKCMLFVLESTNVLHIFAVCAFKFLLPACFFLALRSFTRVFLSLSLTSACLVFMHCDD